MKYLKHGFGRDFIILFAIDASTRRDYLDLDKQKSVIR